MRLFAKPPSKNYLVQLMASHDDGNFLTGIASAFLRLVKSNNGGHFLNQTYKFRSALFGHTSVNQNLIRGLQSLNAEVQFNSKFKNSSQSIGVLAGSYALKKIISRSDSTTVVAGPNFYSDEPLLLNPKVKLSLVPSNWVINMINTSNLYEKTRVWAVGVDTEFWKPIKNRKNLNEVRHGLIYVKSNSAEISSLQKSIMNLSGFKWSLIRYGAYRRIEFKRLLSEVDFCIYLGSSESQGLAQFECWSMDIPTFVFDCQRDITVQLKITTVKLRANQYSVAPYLNSATGSLWHDMTELETLINYSKPERFTPRIWIKENATLSISAEKYLKHLRS